MKVKFNMLNMIKSKSLYNEGMKVLCYSEQRQTSAKESREKDGLTKEFVDEEIKDAFEKNN